MDPDLIVHSSDDEETLLMKENLIKIRLKKKKLAKQASSAPASPDKVPFPARPSTPPPKPLSTLQNPFASPKSARSGAASTIQVPGSPSPQKRRGLPVSPARIILGIDKGRTGRDVSLRRTPEKPSKTFNQRLAEQKSEEHRQVQKRETGKSRISSFNPVPAFSSDNELADKDGPTQLSITHRKVSAEDCDKAASCVTKVFSIHQFYAEVSLPAYELPDHIHDYILFGIVAAKSDSKTTSNGSKYCVITLTDLKTDIVLFLYDSAFDKYWTLALGSLCYFLNPQHQKPRGAGSKLSIKMTDETGVLEIGKSADFGICRSIKKDGTQCTAWINAKKQEVCDFHIDMTLAKTSNKRLEFASGTRSFDPRQPTKKRLVQMEEHAQHAVFFGDAITTLKGGSDAGFEAPVKDTARLQRESEARQREREVLARLMKHSAMSAGHEYFETTDPNAIDEDIDEQAEREKVFSATVLRKLGFDPTKRPNFSVSAHSQTSGIQPQLEENAAMTDREVTMQKDAASIDLKVEMGKGSAMFTKAGLEATARASREQEAQQGAANESDSDLEIVV